MGGGAWWTTVHGVAKSRTWLSDFTLTFHFHALEQEMATHSSVLARRIPGTGEPGGLPSMGSHRVGHDWSDLAAAAAALLKTLLREWKDKPQMGENNCNTYKWYRAYTYSIQRTLKIVRRQTIQFLKRQKDLNRHLTKQDTQMTDKHMKRWSKSHGTAN